MNLGVRHARAMPVVVADQPVRWVLNTHWQGDHPVYVSLAGS